MYRWVIRPLLFILSPEKIHDWLVFTIKIVYRLPLIPAFIKYFYTTRSVKLEKIVLGIKFPNPVGMAAGFDKNASIYKEFSSFGFGFIEIGTVTPKPQPGNPKPRLFRLTKDKALINRMGFNNPGVEKVAEMLKNRPGNIIIGGNIGKNTETTNDKIVDDYVYCFQRLYDYVDYFTVNVSCPNIGDISKLQDKETLEAILSNLSEIRKTMPVIKPVFLKISPDLNFTQIDEVIDIIQRLHIDGIVAVNTTTARDNLVTPVEKIQSIGDGGLSGAPLRERSNQIIRYIKDKTGGKLPVIGSGGITSVDDAIEKLNAGADLIQVYTGFIYEGPGFIKKINKRLLKNCPEY